MRNYTSSNVSADYPGPLVFSQDNNFMLFANLYGAYRMKVSVTITAGGGSATYTYTTQIGTLTVRLNQFLRSLPHGTAANISWQTDVFDGTNTYTDTGNFKTKWLFGKTLQERHHGSETIVTWCDSGDLNNFEIYHPDQFVCALNNAGNLSMVSGDESIIKSTPGQPTKWTFTGTSPQDVVWRGEIFDDHLQGKWSVEYRQVCPPRNGIKLVYYNTDGCKRYAIGQVVQKTMKAERMDYHRGGSVYDEVPRSLVTGYEGTFKVLFSDVEPGQYLEDIMLSQLVTTLRGTETIEVIPTTLQLVRDGKTKDIEITFKIDA